ncbi:TPA: hypothetical protein M2F31_005027, partial [Escherichia coli]|nr:hypothetical protein [Escherichia coli]
MRARLYDYTSCPDFCGFVSPERWRNVGSFCAAPPSTEARSSGNRTANHSAVFVPQLFRAIDKLAVGESHEVRSSGNRTANHSAVFVPQLFRAIDKLAVGESHEVRTYTISTSFRLRAVCDA